MKAREKNPRAKASTTEIKISSATISLFIYETGRLRSTKLLEHHPQLISKLYLPHSIIEWEEQIIKHWLQPFVIPFFEIPTSLSATLYLKSKWNWASAPNPKASSPPSPLQPPVPLQSPSLQSSRAERPSAPELHACYLTPDVNDQISVLGFPGARFRIP